MDFKMKKYEVCPKCHNIKQCDDFTIMQVYPNVLYIENKCYTCNHVENSSYVRIEEGKK